MEIIVHCFEFHWNVLLQAHWYIEVISESNAISWFFQLILANRNTSVYLCLVKQWTGMFWVVIETNSSLFSLWIGCSRSVSLYLESSRNKFSGCINFVMETSYRPPTYFVLEIRWRLPVHEISYDFWHKVHCSLVTMSKPSSNLQPHGNSYEGLANCSEKNLARYKVWPVCLLRIFRITGLVQSTLDW